MKITRLFDTENLPSEAEQFETLLERGGVRLERIVSFGHPTPQGLWYDQSEREWVTLLRGEATLRYDSGELLELKAGEALVIEPHVKHRVESVSTDAIWLALFV